MCPMLINSMVYKAGGYTTFEAAPNILLFHPSLPHFCLSTWQFFFRKLFVKWYAYSQSSTVQRLNVYNVFSRTLFVSTNQHLLLAYLTSNVGTWPTILGCRKVYR